MLHFLSSHHLFSAVIQQFFLGIVIVHEPQVAVARALIEEFVFPFLEKPLPEVVDE